MNAYQFTSRAMRSDPPTWLKVVFLVCLAVFIFLCIVSVFCGILEKWKSTWMWKHIAGPELSPAMGCNMNVPTETKWQLDASVPVEPIRPFNPDAVKWINCTAIGCARRWPHPEDSEDTMCAPCFALAERMRCVNALEYRVAKLDNALKYNEPSPEAVERGIAVMNALREAVKEIRKLPEQTA